MLKMPEVDRSFLELAGLRTLSFRLVVNPATRMAPSEASNLSIGDLAMYHKFCDTADEQIKNIRQKAS